jgi:hypothetical protein
MRLAFSMTLVVIAASTALAWDEPDAVRGLTWGASQEDLRRVAKDRGEPAPLCTFAAPYDTCTTGGEIGPVRATIHYRFRDDKFVSAALGFLPTDFSLIRPIFVERYGDPTKRREERFQTWSRVKAMNPVLVWQGRKVNIELRMYGRTLNTGLAEIALRSEVDRLDAERSKSIKKGKDDL